MKGPSKAAMRAPLIIAAKLAAFALGAYVSAGYEGYYTYRQGGWVVGPVFGAVVLAWRWRPGERFDALRALRFLASSALIYALVVVLLSREAVVPAVFLGTALLGIAHAIFLGASWTRTAVAVPAIFACWYLLAVTRVGEWLNAIAAWQALYLIFFFGGWSFGRRLSFLPDVFSAAQRKKGGGGAARPA